MGLCLRRLRLQYPLQGWQVSSGISGNFRLESVAGFDRNQWQPSRGIRSDGYSGEKTGPALYILSAIRQIINMEPLTANLLCLCTHGSSLAPSQASPGEKEHAYAAGC